MTIEKAFKHLVDNWEKLPQDFRHKNRMWKSRYLNLSGNQVKKLSEAKMRQLLKECGYKEGWEIPKKLK